MEDSTSAVVAATSGAVETPAAGISDLAFSFMSQLELNQLGNSKGRDAYASSGLSFFSHIHFFFKIAIDMLSEVMNAVWGHRRPACGHFKYGE